MDSEDEIETLPYEFIEKSAVLQEAKHFDAVSVDPSRCVEAMLKVLYLIGSGETFMESEATGVFMSATKLFQCESQRVHRILFILLKELSRTAEQTFIASASLVKDITGNNDAFRSNAIRCLRMVSDPSMIGPMERYLRQGVVDRNYNVNSAAIVSGIHLCNVQPEIVKRWGTEVSEALKTKGNKVQYHALALLHKLRRSDRMSVLKLVQQAQSGPLRSPMALCLLIKHCTELMQEDFGQSLELYKWVANMTHHHSDMVVFEACKSICSLRNITQKEITPAVHVLQLYLGSHRPVLRFAAVRLLSRVATFHPTAIQTCSVDLEGMITDSNRNIATLAITTLLKAGNEFNTERLLKQIQQFMTEITDEFKVVVIDAMRILCVKFPQKYSMILDFLQHILHCEGGAELKRAIVETMISLAKNNKEARECALMHLCEFIEDCEYNALVIRVLYVVGEEAPNTANPARYIRFVYNRIALEAPVVRAAAVSTLAKLGPSCTDIRPRIVILLERCTTDVDDEVRDRAVMYYKVLSCGDEYIVRSMILDVADAARRERAASINTAHVPGSAADVGVDEAALIAASASGTQGTAAPSATSGGAATEVAAAQQSQEVTLMCDAMRKIPQIRALGEPSRSSDATLLTEPDNEYVVAVVKHVYPSKMVFQYRVQNTMDESILRKVMVSAATEEIEGIEAEFAIPVDAIKPGETQHTYVVFNKDPDDLPVGSVQSEIKFAIEEEGDEPGEADSYGLDEFAVNLSDYISPQILDFDSKWNQLEEEERVDTYELKTMRNLTQAATEIIDFFGMQVVGGKPSKITTKSHVVQMAGVVTGEEPQLVLISAKVFLTADSSIALELSLRGGSEELREFLSVSLVS